MNVVDVKSYKDDYLKHTREDLDRLNKLLKENPEEIPVIHRLLHTIKGRSFFMGYHDLGVVCLNAEKMTEHKLKMGASLGEGEIKKLLTELERINLLLEKI